MYMRFLGMGIGHHERTAAPPFNAAISSCNDIAVEEENQEVDPAHPDGASEDEEELQDESDSDSDPDDVGFDNF